MTHRNAYAIDANITIQEGTPGEFKKQPAAHGPIVTTQRVVGYHTILHS